MLERDKINLIVREAVRYLLSLILSYPTQFLRGSMELVQEDLDGQIQDGRKDMYVSKAF